MNVNNKKYKSSITLVFIENINKTRKIFKSPAFLQMKWLENGV